VPGSIAAAPAFFKNATGSLEAGRSAYQARQFNAAAKLWQTATDQAASQGDCTTQALALNYLHKYYISEYLCRNTETS